MGAINLRVEIATQNRNERANMDDHNYTVFPHDTHQKPKSDPDDERQDVPRNDVKAGKAITDKLNDCPVHFTISTRFMMRSFGIVAGTIRAPLAILPIVYVEDRMTTSRFAPVEPVFAQPFQTQKRSQ
jgi:hypothetical protein